MERDSLKKRNGSSVNMLQHLMESKVTYIDISALKLVYFDAESEVTLRNQTRP